MKRRARGQALPLVLALGALGALALVLLYNGGRTIGARVRLTHAADAVAYSGALVQARTLNLLAHINRAQVAHQVAMAHLVTLASWLQFGQAEARRAARGNPPAFLIGMFYGPAHGMAYQAARRAEAGDDALARLATAHAAHDQVVHGILAASTRQLLEGLPAARAQAMQAVLDHNYAEPPVSGAGDGGTAAAAEAPGADADAPRTATATATATARGSHGVVLRVEKDEWPGFVARYAGHAGGAFRPLVGRAAGRYGFLDARDGVAHNPWPVSPRCPLMRHQLRRRGGTSLDARGRWHSVDTQSHHALRSNKYIGCYYREYAMGWGRTIAQAARAAPEATPAAPEDFSQTPFWRWVRSNTHWDIVNGLTNPLAYAYARQHTVRWPGRGMAAYAEIPQARMQAPAGLAISLRLPAARMPTTGAASGVAAPSGRFNYTGLTGADHLVVRSAAETYFERPVPRADGRGEHATLFRPYWQARLTAAAGALTRWRHHAQ